MKILYRSFVNFNVKYIWAKYFLNEINCIKPLLSNTVYGRRHYKLFTNCHVSCMSAITHEPLDRTVKSAWQVVFELLCLVRHTVAPIEKSMLAPVSEVLREMMRILILNNPSLDLQLENNPERNLLIKLETTIFSQKFILQW